MDIGLIISETNGIMKKMPGAKIFLLFSGKNKIRKVIEGNE